MGCVSHGFDRFSGRGEVLFSLAASTQALRTDEHRQTGSFNANEAMPMRYPTRHHKTLEAKFDVQRCLPSWGGMPHTRA
jgi:hypothetical protein